MAWTAHPYAGMMHSSTMSRLYKNFSAADGKIFISPLKSLFFSDVLRKIRFHWLLILGFSLLIGRSGFPRVGGAQLQRLHRHGQRVPGSAEHPPGIFHRGVVYDSHERFPAVGRVRSRAKVHSARRQVHGADLCDPFHAERCAGTSEVGVWRKEKTIWWKIIFENLCDFFDWCDFLPSLWWSCLYYLWPECRTKQTTYMASHGESQGSNSACGFLFDAHFAHAACHCFNWGTVAAQGLCLVREKWKGFPKKNNTHRPWWCVDPVNHPAKRTSTEVEISRSYATVAWLVQHLKKGNLLQ